MKNTKRQSFFQWSHKCLPDKTYRNWIFLSPPHPPQMHNCPCQSATKFIVLMIIELPHHQQCTLLTSTPILLRIIIIVVWLIVPPSLSNPSKPFFRESTWFKNIYHFLIFIKSHETTDTLYFKIQRCFYDLSKGKKKFKEISALFEKWAKTFNIMNINRPVQDPILSFQESGQSSLVFHLHPHPCLVTEYEYWVEKLYGMYIWQFGVWERTDGWSLLLLQNDKSEPGHRKNVIMLHF